MLKFDRTVFIPVVVGRILVLLLLLLLLLLVLVNVILIIITGKGMRGRMIGHGTEQTDGCGTGSGGGTIWYHEWKGFNDYYSHVAGI